MSGIKMGGARAEAAKRLASMRHLTGRFLDKPAPDPLIEAMARAMCRFMHVDPDEMVISQHFGRPKVPHWQRYVGHVTAALAVADPVIRERALREALGIVQRHAISAATMAGAVAAEGIAQDVAALIPTPEKTEMTDV